MANFVTYNIRSNNLFFEGETITSISAKDIKQNSNDKIMINSNDR